MCVLTCCSKVSSTPTASRHMPRFAYTSSRVLYVTRLGWSPAASICKHTARHGKEDMSDTRVCHDPWTHRGW